MLRSRSATTAPALSSGAYLARLGDAQARLAAAERSIPRRARTASAFSRASLQLAAAVLRLSRDLRQLTPPRSVAVAHARLVAIMNTYAGRLLHASRAALRPGGELGAAKLLLDSTGAASRNFTATVSQINHQLGQ
jgi:hypothetical protein